MRTVLETGLKVLNVSFRETIGQVIDKVKVDLLSKVNQKCMLLTPINTNWCYYV